MKYITLIHQTTQKNYEKINNYLLSNKLDSALFLLNAFVDYFPNDKVAFTKLGHIYHIKEDYEKAKNNYFRALNIDSSYVPAMIYFIESKYGLYDLGLAQLLPNDGINYLNKIVIDDNKNELFQIYILGRELILERNLMKSDFSIYVCRQFTNKY